MYEELYAELPDINQYWKRLGMVPPDGDPSRELLDRIILAHQCAIPFENLAICEGRLPVSLGIEDLFQKIIVESRGGYCFELNALFNALLSAVGFQVAPCFARSLKDYGYVQPIMHRGALVTLDGRRLYCDVGYGGPMPACALPLVDGAEVVSCGQVFRIEAREGSWWHILYRGGKEQVAAMDCGQEEARPALPVLAFSEAPCNTVDFVPLSHFASTHPNSVFTQRRMVNRRLSDGNASITANQFTCVSAEGKQVKEIASDEEFRTLLVQHFGIVLPA